MSSHANLQGWISWFDLGWKLSWSSFLDLVSSEVGFFSLSSVNSISKMGKMCLIRSLTVSLVGLDRLPSTHDQQRTWQWSEMDPRTCSPWTSGPECKCHESCGCQGGEGELLWLYLKVYRKGWSSFEDQNQLTQHLGDEGRKIRSSSRPATAI